MLEGLWAEQESNTLTVASDGDLGGMDSSHRAIGIIQAQKEENVTWFFFLTKSMSHGLKESCRNRKEALLENQFEGKLTELVDWPDMENDKRMFPSTISFLFLSMCIFSFSMSFLSLLSDFLSICVLFCPFTSVSLSRLAEMLATATKHKMFAKREL